MERRAHVRHQVRLQGELIWNGGASRQPCTIRDLSLNGARVETIAAVEATGDLFLLEPETSSLFECQVRWQRGAEMGLFFIDVGSQAARRALIQRHAQSA